MSGNKVQISKNDKNKNNIDKFSDTLTNPPTGIDWNFNKRPLTIVIGKNGTRKTYIMYYIKKEIKKENEKKAEEEKVLTIYRQRNPYFYRSVDDEYSNELEEEEPIDDMKKLIEHLKSENKSCICDYGNLENNIYYYYYQLLRKNISVKGKLSEKCIFEEIFKVVYMEICDFLLKSDNDTNYMHMSLLKKLYNHYTILENEILCNEHLKKIIGCLKLNKLIKQFKENQVFKDVTPENFNIEIESTKAEFIKLINYYIRDNIIGSINEKIAEFYPYPSHTYKIEYKVDEENTENNKLTFEINTAKEISQMQLSSGQAMLFKIFIWSTLKKLDILLLDEPDLHFDPEFSRIFFKVIDLHFIQNGIQVIIITHRVDTIALAPHDSIFENQVVEVNGSKKFILSPRQKLHALFKLTSNLREINNLHIKVYTESLEDANFYNGVYRTLMSYCDRIRLQNEDDFRNGTITTPGDRFKWKGNNNSIEIGRILSRRFQMDFCSMCFENGEGGGESVVKKMVELAVRSQNNIYNSLNKNKNTNLKPLIDPRMEKPFGLIDKDYKDENKADKSIVLLKRHSLENFIYDPIILASVFDITELGELNINGKLNDIIINIREQLVNLQNDNQADNQNITSVNELQKKINFYFEIFLTELLAKACLENHGFDNLQKMLDLLDKERKAIATQNVISSNLLLKIKCQRMDLINQIKGSLEVKIIYPITHFNSENYDQIILAIEDNEKPEMKRISFLKEIFKNLEKYSYKKLQKSINDYFEIILSHIHKDINEKLLEFYLNDTLPIIVIFNNKTVAPLTYPKIFFLYKNEELKDLLRDPISKINSETKTIEEFRKDIVDDFLNDKKLMNILINENYFIKIEYPSIFLILRGHDIENVIENKNKIEKPENLKKYIENKIDEKVNENLLDITYPEIIRYQNKIFINKNLLCNDPINLAYLKISAIIINKKKKIF